MPWWKLWDLAQYVKGLGEESCLPVFIGTQTSTTDMDHVVPNELALLCLTVPGEQGLR